MMYILILNGKIDGSVEESDIDNVLTTGIYRINNTSGLLWVNRWNVEYVMQMRNKYGHDEFEYRIMRSGVWGSWIQFMYVGNAYNMIDKNNVDLNAILVPGLYYAHTDSASTATTFHYPSSNGGTNGLLIVLPITNSGQTFRQFYFRTGTVDSTDMYLFTRTINGSNYGTWKQFTLS